MKNLTNWDIDYIVEALIEIDDIDEFTDDLKLETDCTGKLARFIFTNYSNLMDFERYQMERDEMVAWIKEQITNFKNQ